MSVMKYSSLAWRAGAINASQLAQLFQNLGNPLPYDRLTKIMCDYDVARKGMLLCPA